MGLILANMAMHIITVTPSGRSSKPAHAGSAGQRLSPWRPWAVRTLTEVSRRCVNRPTAAPCSMQASCCCVAGCMTLLFWLGCVVPGCVQDNCFTCGDFSAGQTC
jgi:hypothetical protein